MNYYEDNDINEEFVNPTDHISHLSIVTQEKKNIEVRTAQMVKDLEDMSFHNYDKMLDLIVDEFIYLVDRSNRWDFTDVENKFVKKMSNLKLRNIQYLIDQTLNYIRNLTQNIQDNYYISINNYISTLCSFANRSIEIVIKNKNVTEEYQAIINNVKLNEKVSSQPHIIEFLKMFTIEYIKGTHRNSKFIKFGYYTKTVPVNTFETVFETHITLSLVKIDNIYMHKELFPNNEFSIKDLDFKTTNIILLEKQLTNHIAKTIRPESLFNEAYYWLLYILHINENITNKILDIAPFGSFTQLIYNKTSDIDISLMTKDRNNTCLLVEIRDFLQLLIKDYNVVKRYNEHNKLYQFDNPFRFKRYIENNISNEETNINKKKEVDFFKKIKNDSDDEEENSSGDEKNNNIKQEKNDIDEKMKDNILENDDQKVKEEEVFNKEKLKEIDIYNNRLRMIEFFEESFSYTCPFTIGELYYAKNIPLLSITYKEVKLELSLNNCLGTYNSEMIRIYNLFDARVSMLINIVKDWSKEYKINGNYYHHLSSFCYTMLVLFFLVQKEIIPPFNYINDNLISIYTYQKDEYCTFSDVMIPNSKDLEYYISKFEKTNKQSIAELFIEFLIFYGYVFDSSLFYIDIREKSVNFRNSLILKEIKKKSYYNVFQIIDPFDLSYNPGAYFNKNHSQEKEFYETIYLTLEKISKEVPLF